MEVSVKKPEIEHYIDEQVKTGRFPTREAVVEDALSRMMEEEIVLDPKAMTQMVQSEAEMERGEFMEFQGFAVTVREKHIIPES